MKFCGAPETVVAGIILVTENKQDLQVKAPVIIKYIDDMTTADLIIGIPIPEAALATNMAVKTRIINLLVKTARIRLTI